MYKLGEAPPQTEAKVGSLVSLAKSINYLTKKKQEFEARQARLKTKALRIGERLKELAEEIECCGYTSYQALIEEIQGIKISSEYVQEAGKDKNHYLRKQVAVMESLAPKLKSFEKLFID
jgi:oligoendopeptidase F